MVPCSKSHWDLLLSSLWEAFEGLRHPRWQQTLISFQVRSLRTRGSRTGRSIINCTSIISPSSSSSPLLPLSLTVCLSQRELHYLSESPVWQGTTTVLSSISIIGYDGVTAGLDKFDFTKLTLCTSFFFIIVSLSVTLCISFLSSLFHLAIPV